MGRNSAVARVFSAVSGGGISFPVLDHRHSARNWIRWSLRSSSDAARSTSASTADERLSRTVTWSYVFTG